MGGWVGEDFFVYTYVLIGSYMREEEEEESLDCPVGEREGVCACV